MDDGAAEVSTAFFVACAVVMAGYVSGPLFVADLETRQTGGFSVGELHVRDHSSRTLTWDDFCYVPRLNAFSIGSGLVDPWNVSNPGWRGWGLFPPLPPAVGGLAVRLLGRLHLGLAVWSLLNAFCIALLVFAILRGPPFGLPASPALLATFLFLSAPWIGALPPELWRSQLRALLSGRVPETLNRIECGLLTYLPYVLFLWSYWRLVAAPTRRRGAAAGILAGVLGYVYFYHYVFAFLLLGCRGALLAWRRRFSEARVVALALAIGGLVVAPALVANLHESARLRGIEYLERLAFSAGRIPPLDDYLWLRALLVPLVAGAAYAVAGSRDRRRRFLLSELLVLAAAYVMALHLRVLLGYMQAPDHFWRYSLGLPASLWTLAVAAELSRLGARRSAPFRHGLHAACLLLPLLLVVRGVYRDYRPSRLADTLASWEQGLSDGQRDLLARLEAMGRILRPGDGFLTTDVALNYHVMVNLKARPFVAFSMSPVSLDELTGRYLMGGYLVGRDGVAFPEDRDTQLYLYLNFFHVFTPTPDRARELRGLYRAWDPERIDWERWRPALLRVRGVFVARADATRARRRLGSHFELRRSLFAAGGEVLEVRWRDGSR